MATAGLGRRTKAQIAAEKVGDDLKYDPANRVALLDSAGVEILWARTPEERAVDTKHLQGCMNTPWWAPMIEKGFYAILSARDAETKVPKCVLTLTNPYLKLAARCASNPDAHGAMKKLGYQSDYAYDRDYISVMYAHTMAFGELPREVEGVPWVVTECHAGYGYGRSVFQSKINPYVRPAKGATVANMKYDDPAIQAEYDAWKKTGTKDIKTILSEWWESLPPREDLLNEACFKEVKKHGKKKA